MRDEIRRDNLRGIRSTYYRNVYRKENPLRVILYLAILAALVAWGVGW